MSRESLLTLRDFRTNGSQLQRRRQTGDVIGLIPLVILPGSWRARKQPRIGRSGTGSGLVTANPETDNLRDERSRFAAIVLPRQNPP